MDGTSIDYTGALNLIANAFSKVLEFVTSVQFADPGVDETSITVVINGVPSTAFSYDKVSQILQLIDPGPPGAKLDITYCIK